MAVLTREDAVVRIAGYVGERNGDEDISFIEDLNDTLADLDSRASGQEDWKARYEENDKQWRDRYKERFGSGETGTGDSATAPLVAEDQDTPSYDFADLFS